MLRILISFIFIISNISLVFSNNYYLDPENGSLQNDGSQTSPWPSIEEVIAANMLHTFRNTLPFDQASNVMVEVNPEGQITAGDTLFLMSGFHGAIDIQGAYNESFITIFGAEDQVPFVKYVKVRAGSNWRFQGLEVSSEPYGEYLNSDILWLNTHNYHGPVYDVEIYDCNLHSTLESGGWTAMDWLTKASSGIRIEADGVKVDNCYLKNINFGISCIGDSINITNSTVENFSGDGVRVLGPNIVIEGNTIKNCYNVNDNHDDGIQSFNLSTYDVRNVIIRGNTIINTEDPNQPLQGPLQGIGCFDGPYNNWIIENNVVSVNHWHAISMYGAYDCVIRNNTVIDPTPDIEPGPSWIRINPNKDDTPSEGNFVANNLCNTLIVTGSTVLKNTIMTTYDEYEANFNDFSNFDFSLRSGSSVIDAGIDSLAAPFDIIGTVRPQGLASDIGAFEFVSSLSIISEYDPYSVYPNPTNGLVNVPEAINNFKVYSANGKFISVVNVVDGRLDISYFPEGFYILIDDKGNSIKVAKK